MANFRRCRAVGTAISFSLLLLASTVAHAQTVVPPRVENVPEPEVKAEGNDVTVDLEITILADGTAKDLRVVSAANPRYDDAALSAIARATFVPAMKDGTATPARIRYAFVFRAPPPPASEPIESDVAPTASPAAAEPSPATPLPTGEEPSFGARGVTDAPPRETTVRSMGGTELRSLGTRGDPLRAVELLPGFGRTTLGQTQPLIRGSTGYESSVFFEGMPVPLLYHFGGLTSFVPARFIDRVDFYPGNFSARYGRVLGGVIDVRPRDPKTDGFHGGVDASFIDASAWVETPIVGAAPPGEVPPSGNQVSASLGFRRSYVDLFFKSLVPKDAISVSAAPVYDDYQGLVTARLGDKHRARLLVYGSEDHFAVVAKKPADSDASMRGKLAAETNFHQAQAELKSDWSKIVSQTVSIGAGAERYHVLLGSLLDQSVDATTLHGRGEWVVRPSTDVRFTFGIDHISQYWYGTYSGLRPTTEGSPNLPPSTIPQTGSLTVGRWTHAPAAYLETAFLLADRVTVIPSVRSDYFGQTSSLTIDPRLAVRVRATDTTTVKAGIGKFSQHPQVWQALPDVGNPHLEPGYAIHGSAGVEQTLPDARLSIEGFAKSLHHLPVDTVSYAPPFFDNAGRGRVIGLEVEARILPTRPVYGLLAYTLSRSERAREGQAFRLFENDQTHVGSVAAVARLGRGWEAGATFRLTSANPSTPVVGSVYDARSDTYVPRYGTPFSDRAPLYHRLDLHLEKTWRFTAWRLMGYLDIQNVYNAKNAETPAYNYDYTQKRDTASFPPFFPSLGLRAEL